MTRRRATATAAAAAAERCAMCRAKRLLALMTIIGTIGTCSVAAEDRVELPRVPRVNASGSFGIFWSCGSALEFASCTTLPNVSCTAATKVGTFNSSITAASFHYNRAEVYMIFNQSEVRRLRLASGDVDILYQAAPGHELLCIAVDWLNQEFYLIVDRRVRRCNLNASACVEVLTDRATNVREVAVDPNNGWIFWTAGNGSVWRDALPTESAVAVGNKSQPVALAAAGSSCPGRGFAVVSQLGIANVTVASGSTCHSSQSLNITSFSVKRTNPLSLPPSRSADAAQGFSTAAFDLATSGSSGLVCANANTCMWIDPGGGGSGRRLIVVDLARSVTQFASLPTDDGANETVVCVALALWHRDLQYVPAPLMPPKNVEVVFTTVSAVVTWDPPNSYGSGPTKLIWPTAGRNIYESVWRNWMYKVSVQASDVRAGAMLGGVALTLPELQVCLVQSRGSRMCRFDGLSSYWLYNISVTAYSSSGGTSNVVRGSPLRDGSPVLIGATGGLAYSLLNFENGSVLAQGVAGSSSSYSSSTMTAVQQSAIRDLAVAGSNKLIVVLGNRTVLQTDRSLLLSMLQPPAEGPPTVAAAVAATPPGLDSSSVRFDGCAATPRAEAVAWDWISGSLYVATATGIVRLAAGCSGRAEQVVAESAVAIVVVPLVEHLILWITVDRRSLKYCKLASRCRAGDVATIYSSPCGTTYLGQCVPEVLSVTVDVDDHMLYWTLKQSPGAKQMQLYAAPLSNPTAYRELIGDSKPSTPSLVAHGGKILWINGSRLVVRDSRGDAVGSYPFAGPPLSSLWPLHNYSRWLLPGFADVDAMHAATRPRRIDAASSRVTVDGSATNFTIRWPYLNASTLVDVFYSVTINGTGISQSEVVYSVPAVNVAKNSVVPLSSLRVTVVAFTHWLTGEPYTSDIAVPAAVPPAPNNLEAFVEYGARSIIWLYWDQDYLPGAPVINTTIFVTKLDNQSSSSSDLFVGAAFGSQRSFRFSSPGDGQEYSARVVSCNAAGCSNFSTPIPVSTEAGKLAPLPRLVVVQSSGLVLDSDYRLSEPNVIGNESLENVPVLLAAFVGDAGVSPVWVDSSGCLHQRLAESGHVKSQIGCGLNHLGGAAVDNNRRRLYFLLNDSTVLQVDPVAMENRTVFHSPTGSIHAIAFDKYKRRLLLLMGEQKLIALDADNQTTQSAAGNLRARRHADSACNCTANSSLPKLYALATTVADGAIVFYLENGTVYRADNSLCNCWPIVRASDVDVPGFLPDQISAGDDKLFFYSKFNDALLSSDFWGSKLIVLSNVSAQYIWPYGSFSSAAPAVDFMPVLDRLAPLNANEVRVAWRCSTEATCNITVGTEREAFLLAWLRPSLPGQAVEVNSLKLSSGPYVVSHLSSAATYSMQIWVCNRDSCAHSAVYKVTTFHAPEIPHLLEATNVSLTFLWTAPPDGSVLSHYIRLDSTSGKLEEKIPDVTTVANRQYTMSLHDLTPATDYLARMVVIYKASSPREYQWPLSGLHVSTACSPPATVTISKAECGRLANSNCTVALTYADPSLIAKCQVSFNLSISCLSKDGDASVVLHRSSIMPMFVIPVADMPSADRHLRCIALALAISFSVPGPWSSPLELPLEPAVSGNISEWSKETIAVPLAAGLSAVAGLALIVVAIYVCVCRRRRQKKSQWQAKNRAGREDRRSPEGDSQNLPLVACRLVVPPVDMVVNEGYHTESILHEPPAAPPSWGAVSTAASSSSHSKLPKVDRRKLILLRPLGAGAFGEVFAGVTTLVNDDQEENVPVAVKTLRSDASDTDKSDFLKEAVLMSNFHHKNVVRLIGVCAEADPIYIVIELMQEGDLLDFARRKRPTREAAGQLSLHTLVHMSLDIASGCEYLESLHFVHRDLAARNCLVSSSGHVDCCPLVKIGDFGLARDVYRNDYYRKEGEAFLPVRWMSPESLVDGVFTNQSDVWSFGVLMWELFSLGMQPYTAKSNVEVLQYVRNAGTLDQPLRCPDSMYRLMSQCWSYVPKERPSFMAVRCAVQQILSEVDQNAALVAAYDRCNGRLTSDQEFFSTSSAADDVPLSARMVRQLSDVFDADTKPSPAAAADERVQYRGQNSVRGKLSRIFRRSANTSLLNRVNSQTDPESRKSNIYVRSESVVSSDAVPLRVLSSSRDSAFTEADESHKENFSDFILDSIATGQEAALPNAKTRTVAAQREDEDDVPATVVETVNYSLITPVAKQSQKPSISPASDDSSAACRPADVVAAGPALADARTPRHEHRASNLEGKPARDSTESPTGRQSADSRSAVNYSLVVALPPLSQQQPLPQPSKLDEVDDSCEKVQVTSLPSSDRANKKAALTVKKSVPNTYAYDLHKGSGAAAVASAGTESAVAAATTGEAAPALAARPVVHGSSRAGSSRVAATTERGIPPPVPPPPRDDMGLTAIDYSGEEPQLK